MKLFVIISALMMLSFSLNATAKATAGDESISEASVASPSFDPDNEDCKCLGNKKAQRPLDNEAKDRRVVEWISDPSKPGSAPSYAEPETTN